MGTQSERPPAVTEIVGMCTDSDEEPEQHRVWIAPDGTIATPDHPTPWSHHQVTAALGGHTVTFCDTWRAATSLTQPFTTHTVTKKSTDVPYLDVNILTWRYTHEIAWRTRTQWAANSVLLGQPERRPIPPRYALTITQQFHTHTGTAPPGQETWANMLHLLHSPTSRDVWRRTNPTPPETVKNLLLSGLEPSLVADAAALNISPETAATAAAIFNRGRIPHSWLLGIASVLEPDEIGNKIQQWAETPGDRVYADIVTLYQHLAPRQ